jgi:hypothetical protein
MRDLGREHATLEKNVINQNIGTISIVLDRATVG